MHLNFGATSHKIEEEEVVNQKPSEATMGTMGAAPTSLKYDFKDACEILDNLFDTTTLK